MRTEQLRILQLLEGHFGKTAPSSSQQPSYDVPPAASSLVPPAAAPEHHPPSLPVVLTVPHPFPIPPVSSEDLATIDKFIDALTAAEESNNLPADAQQPDLAESSKQQDAGTADDKFQDATDDVDDSDQD